MRATESVDVNNRRVVVRASDATITVYLGTGETLVAVNRDEGGPTETIPRTAPGTPRIRTIPVTEEAADAD